MLDIIKFNNLKLKELFDNNKLLYYWLSKILTKIFKPMTSYTFEPKFKNEVILLPCIETTKENSIWEEEGKYYTIPINYISYIYLSGRIKNCQRLIDNYTYKY